MQLESVSAHKTPEPPRNVLSGEPGSAMNLDPRYAQYKVIRRNGAVVPFEPAKISVAMTKAFLAVNGGQGAASARVREQVTKLTDGVVAALMKRKPEGGAIHIEEIQDQVELAMMRGGEHEVARAYVLYRERRSQERAHEKSQKGGKADSTTITVIENGVTKPLDMARLEALVRESCTNLPDVDADRILKATLKDLYNGVPMEEVRKCVVLAARTLIEKDPAYSFVTARLLLDSIRHEALGEEASQQDMATKYAEYFPQFVKHGVKIGLLNEALLQYDMSVLGKALVPTRDLQFGYLGLQTLYDRYFLIDQYIGGRRFELPQCFFMRVAMGLALNEVNREARAIEFYNVLSTFDFMSSTPTLFNSGTHRSQLSSCYLTTVADDLDGIYEAIKENALLSKFAGGLGNDWTNVRAMGSHIKGTNGKSQGVVPFLKVVNDTAVAVNQGGKRKGAVCTYLETWHLDIEEFLELRKNTGDDRRRTHDMNTANWIPDLFMKRVMEGGDWTLFSPSDVPDLHDKWGQKFAEAYQRYEEKAAARRAEALQEDPRAAAVAQDAVDAVRDRASVDHVQGCLQRALAAAARRRRAQLQPLHRDHAQHERHRDRRVQPRLRQPAEPHEADGQEVRWELDHAKLQLTIRTAMRMLDNVIDINYYAVAKARNSNLKHRPVGLGVMGFQDCLHLSHTPYASDTALGFADTSMEAVCYYAYQASTELAEERGRYSSYSGSLWDRGILPQDTLKLLREERGGYVDIDDSATMDWDALRSRIRIHGMRNSNCVAIAPTATISNIVGVAASIEPEYQNIYVKSNLSGEFTVINEHLVAELKKISLWDEVMVADLKYFDGSLAKIDRIPLELRTLYATAFEVDAKWIVEAGARRQKWIDQAQSLNIYMAGASGKKLDETYKLAWVRGLKTTYYLRTLAATSAEKSTGQGGELNAVSTSGAQMAPPPAPARATRRRRTTATRPSSARSTIRRVRRASNHLASAPATVAGAAAETVLNTRHRTCSTDYTRRWRTHRERSTGTKQA